MFVIITYDVDKKRCSKAINLLRCYCFHVQDSVFMGELTEKQYQTINIELNKIVNAEKDRILMVRVESIKALKMNSIGPQSMIETIV